MVSVVRLGLNISTLTMNEMIKFDVFLPLDSVEGLCLSALLVCGFTVLVSVYVSWMISIPRTLSVLNKLKNI